MFKRLNISQSTGFSLLEVIIGIAIFAIAGTAIFVSYGNVLSIITTSQSNAAATAVINNEIEIIRNIPYPDVGLRGGSPAGTLWPTKTVYFGGLPFVVNTTVRNVDDSFDGTIGGSPNDSIPGDYKLVEVEVTCPSCPQFKPLQMTTTSSPRALESATRNGALFISVTNASGEALGGAEVSIVNNQVSPAININDLTDNNGQLQFVDIATSSSGYRLTVTKSGHSTDRTYPPGDPANPNPFQPDATVLEQEITKTSFNIDRFSSLTFKTADKFCRPVGGIGVLQTGEKIIGYNPDVPKFSAAFSTNSAGQHVNTSLEWDTYNFKNNSSSYDLIGTSPFLPLFVDPASSSAVVWVMAPRSPKGLLVTVDDEDKLPVDEASVRIFGGAVDQTKITGRETTLETDWSAGQYTSKSAGIEVDDPVGEVRLKLASGSYVYTNDQKLVSATMDMGTADITYYQLDWLPSSQPPSTGPQSIKWQIAANNDNATWDFGGPNGSANSYYTANGAGIYSGHTNKRYLRYKIFLTTNDPAATPVLQEVRFSFRSSCLSSGQTYFSELLAGDYTLSIDKTGFDSDTDTISILDDWQEYQSTLFVP